MGQLGLSNVEFVWYWDAHEFTDPVPATDVDLRYCEEESNSWQYVDINGIAEWRKTIGGLKAGTTYQVQLCSSNAYGTSEWSRSTMAKTPSGNRPPEITGQKVVEIRERTNPTISFDWNDPDGSDPRKLSAIGGPHRSMFEIVDASHKSKFQIRF